MAKRFDKMNAREKFVRLMIRGWKEKKKHWSNRVGYCDYEGTQFCAIGVVGSELGLPPREIGMFNILEKLGLHGSDAAAFSCNRIIAASDGATSKADAIRRVRKVLGV